MGALDDSVFPGQKMETHLSPNVVFIYPKGKPCRVSKIQRVENNLGQSRQLN